MNFDLTTEQEEIRRTTRAFAEAEIAPIAARIDDEASFPKATVTKLGEMGLLGMNIPAEYGGPGADFVSLALATQEISRACASHGVVMSSMNGLVCWPLLTYASEAHKRRYLPELAQGRLLGAFCLSEPGSGSDAAGLQTTARADGADYVLNGSKAWASNGGEAGVFVVFVRTDATQKQKGISCLVVDRDTPGLTVGRKERTMGIRGSSTVQVHFEDARVSRDRLVGAPGQGFPIALATLDSGRFGIGAQAAGIAMACLEEAAAYAGQREAFGELIGHFQSIRAILADVATNIEATRWLTLHAAWLRDHGRPAGTAGSMAKLFASRTAVAAADANVQVHGGAGYTRDFPAERHYRDAKILEIYEGTTQIQQMVIADSLLGRHR
ncbi:MAG: acyl-CoA dehydrogenase family protein [Chloroflexota bacterium]